MFGNGKLKAPKGPWTVAGGDSPRRRADKEWSPEGALENGAKMLYDWLLNNHGIELTKYLFNREHSGAPSGLGLSMDAFRGLTPPAIIPGPFGAKSRFAMNYGNT
jgi:hypothetical protein